MNPHKLYEIRCPVHGFVGLNDLEREIIGHAVFQRLRRIRQLAWTDQVYPGAMHTRFEHSLGVMHTATQLFDAIVRNSYEVLVNALGYTKNGLERHRQLVRLAALLHDLGHSPFSHASEELFADEDGTGKKYTHEQYSAALVRAYLGDVIKNHPLNARNYGFTAEDVAGLMEGSAVQGIFWRDLLSGQMDADRMDYLLRDSLHTGVGYGRFDLHRLIGTVVAIPPSYEQPARVGVQEGGWHAAEALVLARYAMFTQVYFHKTRVAYDIHIREALKQILPDGHFPTPNGEELAKYCDWDDWRVLGHLSSGQGGDHGARLRLRNHYRLAYRTPEIADKKDLKTLRKVKRALRHVLAAEEPAAKSWYKTGAPDIAVVDDLNPRHVVPLSRFSVVVARMKANNQVLLYVRPEDVIEAVNKVEPLFNEDRDNN